MEAILGLGKIDRKRISALILRTKGTISVSEAAGILEVSPNDAAKMLARWAKKGWVSRVRRGLYVLVPLEARFADVPLEDPWIIAERLFPPCYIGGFSAAEYWGLTEQIFRTVVVITMQRPRDRCPNIKGTSFLLRTTSKRAMFGLKTAWRGQVKVSVSDPTRTILDMLNDPKLGGGLRSTVDILLSYLRSENKDLRQLMDYSDRLKNGAVFKRLGYLVDRYAAGEDTLINECRSRLTKGNSKIDPTLSADRLVTKWRLWIPNNWAVGEPR